MNTEQIRLFKRPILIAVLTLVVAALVTSMWILSVQGQLSTLAATHNALESEKSILEAKIVQLEHDKSNLPQNCSQLAQEAVEIPQEASAGSFDDEINLLIAATGVKPTNVSDPVEENTATTSSSTGLTSITVSINLTGTFSQITAFLGDLNTPKARIFQISSVIITPGATSSGGPPSAGSASQNATPSAGATSFFTGPAAAGGAIVPGPGTMSMTLGGIIYYGGGINLDICNGVNG